MLVLFSRCSLAVISRCSHVFFKQNLVQFSEAFRSKWLLLPHAGEARDPNQKFCSMNKLMECMGKQSGRLLDLIFVSSSVNHSDSVDKSAEVYQGGRHRVLVCGQLASVTVAGSPATKQISLYDRWEVEAKPRQFLRRALMIPATTE